MKTSRFLLGLVAILCFACAKPEINVEPELVVPDGAIIGTFEKIVTKASFGSDMSFLWSEEDAIKVLTNKSTREFVLASGAGQSTASFAGSMGSDETLGNVLAFPYDAVNTLTATSVEFNLPSQYTYTQSFTFGSGTDKSVILPCYATIEGKNFTVKHLGGYIVYEISNIPATAIKFVLKTTNGKRINGVFSADLTASPATFAQADATNESEQTVEIRFQAGTSTTQCFIIPVPQGAYSWVWDMYTEADKKVGHGRQDATTVGRNCIVGQREQCATLGDDEDDPQGGDEDGIPDYIENGVNLGKGIAVLGDWNEDGNQTTLYWAPVNCGYEEVGEVNTNSDHRLGKLYQWGAGDSSLPYYYNGTKVVARETYYDSPKPSPWYDYMVIVGTDSDKWNNNQGPCPEGWRLPTSLEFNVLCDGKNGSYGWVDKGTYAGQSNTYVGAEFFGANSDKTAGTGVFFPAAGYRFSNDGSAYSRGTYGRYWSSTPYPDYSRYACILSFGSSYLFPQFDSYRAYAFSVRCVSEGSDSESETEPEPEPEPQEIPSYTENGANLGKGIAVQGDWNEDGTQTTLYWAPVNCGYEEKGTVNSGSDHRLGKLYQWGAGDSSLPYTYNGSPVVAREMYYKTTTPSPWYDYNIIDGTTSDKWNNNQGPCPEGWRLPTSKEFKVLCAGKNGSYGWVSAGTYAGQANTYPGAEFFGANSDKTAGTGVFFPAAGSRGGYDGFANYRGTVGNYWSSTPHPSYSGDAYFLIFYSSRLDPQYSASRAFAFSVRCVTE